MSNYCNYCGKQITSTAHACAVSFGGGIVGISTEALAAKDAQIAKLKKALEEIGCNETFHRLGGIDDCIRCKALKDCDE